MGSRWGLAWGQPATSQPSNVTSRAWAESQCHGLCLSRPWHSTLLRTGHNYGALEQCQWTVSQNRRVKQTCSVPKNEKHVILIGSGLLISVMNTAELEDERKQQFDAWNYPFKWFLANSIINIHYTVTPFMQQLGCVYIEMSISTCPSTSFSYDWSLYEWSVQSYKNVHTPEI